MKLFLIDSLYQEIYDAAIIKGIIMKKATATFTDQSRAVMLQRFQPLYLAKQDLEPSKQIRIFINSSKKHCYIQENGIWQAIIINHSLLGSQKETYYFQAQRLYHYLEIDHDDAYLALVDSDRKIFFKNLDLSKEILQKFEANLEQLNTSAIAKTKLEAKEILTLTRRMMRINSEILCFEKILSVLTDARPAMEGLDNDNKQKFTIADLDERIKLYKRRKHYSEYVKFKAQITIQALLTIGNPEALEDYVRNLLELNLQKREITRSLQDQQRAMAKLKKVAECFADLNSAASDIEQINSQIKLMDKSQQKNILRLQKIEEEIMVSVKPEGSENANLANTPLQSLFFNGVIKSNPAQPIKNCVKKL